tara:strand:- start:132 stop:494 length:363 start_codon:yes stop_codon:yes gene_type:complete
MNVILAFNLFIIKHTLADYFLQYGWMIKDKGTYGAKGGIAHSAVHGVFTLLVLMILDVPLLYSVVLSAFDAVLHYHIDYVKSNFWKEKKLTAVDQMYWIAHGTDQFLHLMTYMVIIALCV